VRVLTDESETSLTRHRVLVIARSRAGHDENVVGLDLSNGTSSAIPVHWDIALLVEFDWTTEECGTRSWHRECTTGIVDDLLVKDLETLGVVQIEHARRRSISAA